MATIIDTDPQSNDYFYITELPETFGGGKNSFIVNTTNRVLPNSSIIVLVFDSAGNQLPTKIARAQNSRFGGETKLGTIYTTEVGSDVAAGFGRIEIQGVAVDLGEYTGSFAYLNGKAYATTPETALPLSAPPSQITFGTTKVIWARNILIDPSQLTTTSTTFFDVPVIEVSSDIYAIPQYPSASYVVSTGAFSSTAVAPRHNTTGDYDSQFVDTTYQINLLSGTPFSSSMVGEKIRLKNVVAQVFTYSNNTISTLSYSGPLNTDFIA